MAKKVVNYSKRHKYAIGDPVDFTFLGVEHKGIIKELTKNKHKSGTKHDWSTYKIIDDSGTTYPYCGVKGEGTFCNII